MKNGMVRYWHYVTKGEKTKSYYTWNIIWLAIYIKNSYWTKINLNMTFIYVCCSVPMLTLHVIVLEKAETLVRGKLNTRNLHLPTNAIYWQRRKNIILLKKYGIQYIDFHIHDTIVLRGRIWQFGVHPVSKIEFAFLLSITLTSKFSLKLSPWFSKLKKSQLHVIIEYKIIVLAK